MTLPARFRTITRRISLFDAWVLFGGIAVVDAVTGAELSLSVFYLLPLGIGLWNRGARMGYAFAIASTIACMATDWIDHVHFSHAAYFYWTAAVRLLFYVAIVELGARLQQTMKALEDSARTDPLTGMYNRRALLELAGREVNRCARSLSPISMAFIDLDGFKALNDSRGHAAGDDVLAAVASVLKTCRSSDLAARVGGDEFVVIFPGSGSHNTRRAVERIFESLLGAMRMNGYPITFSVGVATFEGAQASVEAMLSMADALMYEVKRGGKNAIKHVTVDGLRSQDSLSFINVEDGPGSRYSQSRVHPRNAATLKLGVGH